MTVTNLKTPEKFAFLQFHRLTIDATSAFSIIDVGVSDGFSASALPLFSATGPMINNGVLSMVHMTFQATGLASTLPEHPESVDDRGCGVGGVMLVLFPSCLTAPGLTSVYAFQVFSNC